MIQRKSTTYNDGSVQIYKLTNTARPGGMPVDGLVLKRTLRYKERTVGITRYYKALQDNALIKYVLRCPRHRDVSSQDVAIPNDGRQYRIKQVQYPEDVEPPSMDLTLEEVTAAYDIV